MRRTCWALLCATTAGLAAAQVQPFITYHYKNAALTPPEYTLVVHADGSGSYQPAGTGAPQPITVSPSLRQQLFAAARKQHGFNTPCEAAHNHTAFTGEKTLAYTGPDGSGSCTFNYAKDQQLNDLAQQLEAVAATLDTGVVLSRDLAHDRLGLDAALAELKDAQESGRASDMQNIALVLQSIAADDHVLNRARQTAQLLLTKKAQ